MPRTPSSPTRLGDSGPAVRSAIKLRRRWVTIAPTTSRHLYPHRLQAPCSTWSVRTSQESLRCCLRVLQLADEQRQPCFECLPPIPPGLAWMPRTLFSFQLPSCQLPAARSATMKGSCPAARSATKPRKHGWRTSTSRPLCAHCLQPLSPKWTGAHSARMIALPRLFLQRASEHWQPSSGSLPPTTPSILPGCIGRLCPPRVAGSVA